MSNIHDLIQVPFENLNKIKIILHPYLVKDDHARVVFDFTNSMVEKKKVKP
jgi:hypothetical protein